MGCALMALQNADDRSISLVASNRSLGYFAAVVVNPTTGRRNPKKSRRTGAPSRLQALFLCPLSSVMAAVREQASAWSDSLISDIPTSRTAATQSRRKDRGSFFNQGARPMHTLIPSKIRAHAHRRMALSALRANSSLSVRLARYNAHMEKARALEIQGGAA